MKVGEGAGETVDYGYAGDIDRVDSGLLERLLGIGALPVVSPISADEAGTLLNINADTVASALSVALGAEKLILLGEAPGLLADPGDPGSVVSFLDLAGLEGMRESGAIRTGMLPKAACIRNALQGGCRPRPPVAGGDAGQPAAGGLYAGGLRHAGGAGPFRAVGGGADAAKRGVDPRPGDIAGKGPPVFTPVPRPTGPPPCHDE